MIPAERERAHMLTTEQVAAMLGVSTATVRRWRFDGFGPAPVQVGPRAIRYRRSDVEHWISARRRHRSTPSA